MRIIPVTLVILLKVMPLVSSARGERGSVNVSIADPAITASAFSRAPRAPAVV